MRKPPVLLIPAFRPPLALVPLVDELLRICPDSPLLVVDDGSGEEWTPLFQQLGSRARVRVLRHGVNLGKGQALKTGINEALVSFPGALGVVTVDADGQHRPEDVLRVRQALEAHPGALVLGVREFSSRVPLRSRLGNRLTRRVFRLFSGVDLQDTQTGLRGIPQEFLGRLLRLASGGYEWELEVLLRCARDHVPLKEVPIRTIYEEGNPTSHFNPFLDSVKIYFVFLRFCGISLATALLDYVVFALVYGLGGGILGSFLVARLVAGTFQFLSGKRWVFHSPQGWIPEALRYGGLVLALMGVSYALVRGLSWMGVPVLLGKVLAEGALFFVSFSLQNLWVFGAPRGRDAS